MDPVEEARGLEAQQRYRDARAVLEPALDADPERTEVRVRLAICTYKDPDLHLGSRLDDALRILTGLAPEHAPEALTDQESLGVAGAIFKRKWEADGQEGNLQRAIALYRRAAERGIDEDLGYTAINVAFVLDLLADLEARQDPDSPYPVERRGEARAWRGRVIDRLRPLLEADERPGWWPVMTLAEAYVGRGEFEQAERWIRAAAALRDDEEPALRPKPWELESAARQIAAITRLRQGAPDVRAFRASGGADLVRLLLGDEWAAGLETAWTGKVGLALSGGGFRASLFHIGVLARLAELDVLRRVEVLSCVSGGSILGAYYYLKVRRLLESKPDGELGRDDYLALVEELEREFLEAIGANLRMRLLTNPLRVLKMAVAPGYTRTERAADLYQQLLYSRLGSDDWRLDDLLVGPGGEDPQGFNPARDNWHRAAKVPILVINATTMNTGHNWQFTATWMGEPPSAIDGDVDSADRLRRLYHRQAPERHRRMPLGRAVGASAAVPGLFPPVSLRELYPGITVRLSDGGVHDNQGIASLVEQDCSVVLVSDASGQGQSIAPVGDRALPTLNRTVSVTMARIRQAQWLELVARRAASSLRGLMFVHLKQDLPRADITWEGGEDAPEQTTPPDRDIGTTPYGIREDVQRRLASIRTDLDAFHEYEAFGLMASGYRMAERYFPLGTQGFPASTGRHPWRFCALQTAVEGGENHGRMLAALARSDALFYKWSPWPRATRWIALALVVAVLAGAIAIAAAAAGWAGVAIAVGIMLLVGALSALPDEHPVTYALSLGAKVPLGILGMVVGPLLSWPYLWLLNPRYLRSGRAPSAPREWDS